MSVEKPLGRLKTLTTAAKAMGPRLKKAWREGLARFDQLDGRPSQDLTNRDSFLANQRKYFARSYEQFTAFGGPCVYFHQECLRAAEKEFLSLRHIEMLYATLTAWGMHRMGDGNRVKAKLTQWERFYRSIAANGPRLEAFRGCSMLKMTADDYLHAVERLRPVYTTLELTEARATVVVNSKALHHILPEFIPPIDRQYTVRFLSEPQKRWFNARGSFRPVQLPSGLEAQFRLFRQTCVDLKKLAAQVDPALFEEERRQHGVPARSESA